MSETFLIKKTTFDSNGTIAQKELDSFIIGPGELNGPSGQSRVSDLSLYGIGSLKWGEGVNQNLYRLLENNTCPEKEATDNNPSTGNPYQPGIDPILPKDENDLGAGNGITVPTIGQNWFNADNNLTYTYTTTGWKTIVNEDGSLSLNGLLDMGGFGIFNLADPTASPSTIFDLTTQDAITVNWAEQRYVKKRGDTMTGILNMQDNTISNLSDPSALQDAMNLRYADSTYVNITGDTITGSLIINNDLTVLGTTNFVNTPTVGVNNVWHAGNDGTGSGLDADTVDGIHTSDLINLIYPLGSIYMSVNSTNPSTYPFFAGTTWLQYAQGKTVIGQDPTNPLFNVSGNAGGSATPINVSHSHTFTGTVLPNHDHSLQVLAVGHSTGENSPNAIGTEASTAGTVRTMNYPNHQANPTSAGTPAGSISTVGTDTNPGQPGENANLPPYIVTYMWQRTA